MCLFSEDQRTLQMHVGETSIFGPVRSRHLGRYVTAVLPTASCPDWIACMCVADGAVLRLSGLDRDLQGSAGLISSAALVVFKKGVRSEVITPDRFLFENGSIEKLDRRFNGVEVTFMAESMKKYLDGWSPAVHAKVKSSEPKLVGAGSSRDFIRNCNGEASYAPSEVVLAGITQAFRGSRKLLAVLGAVLLLAH